MQNSDMGKVYYLFNSWGFCEVPEEAYNMIAEKSLFTTDYERLFDGMYMQPTEEQVAFNLANPGLDIYRAYNMIAETTEEKNEKIRQRRQNLYTAKTDKLYMAYMKYKELGDTGKAEAAREEWRAAVEEIEKNNPYITL